MKQYTDVFGKPLDKGEVARAAQIMVNTKHRNATTLQRGMGIGYGKASRIVEVLEDANVIGPLMKGNRSVILKSDAAAMNAALRQLKKGKK